MARKRCKSPGCSRAARWARTSYADEDIPEFLCAPHWTQMRADSPVAALGYGPVSLQPGEVLARHAVVKAKKSQGAHSE